MSLKVGIFTTNSVDKLHPRIQMQQEILIDTGFDVHLIRSKNRREGFFFELLNLLFLKYFKWGFIQQSKKLLSNYEIIHIYDLQLLPLAKHAKLKGKKVIYETLDDNVHLNFHAVSKKLPFLKPFRSLIIGRMEKYERRTTRHNCDQVIVNSGNLLDIFDKSELIYYASHLEILKVEKFDPKKKTAFLYLGKLTKAKGAEFYADLIKKHTIPLLFLGKAFDEAANKLLELDGVEHLGEFNSMELIAKLKDLIAQYNLIGLSIILPENKSYALQEANKDIDYLSMNLPFIGNDRKPTIAKLKLGAGVLFSNEPEVMALVTNQEGKYDRCRANCSTIYKDFSQAQFKAKLLSIYSSQ
jgi:hypothetical protein